MRLEEIGQGLDQGRWDDRLAAWYGASGVRAGKMRLAALLATMRSLFGPVEALVFSAPGRTELGGNHTDHNHGRVLTAAVHLDCLALATPRDDLGVVIHSQGFAEPIALNLSDLTRQEAEAGTSAAMVRGVAAALRAEGFAIRGFSACVAGEVPVGSGLSSSAAFEVLSGAIFSHLANGGEIPPLALARAAKTAENVYFGKPCGFMDQLACAVQGVLRIDFEDPAHPRVEQMDADLDRLGYRLVVVNTGGSHADLTEEYAAIPREMHLVASLLGRESLRGLTREEVLGEVPRLRGEAGDRAVLRALHFLEEDERVVVMARTLAQGDAGAYLALVNASGDSSWRLLQNCVSFADPGVQPIPLALVLSERLLKGRGAWRVQGGGFAGTIQAYVAEEDLERYRQGMERVFGPGSVVELRVRRPSGFSLWDRP